MLKKLLAALAAGLALVALLRPRPPRRPPNIVLILIDTLRRDHLPVYGYARDTAPFLGELARRGVVMDHAYSTSAWTPPATASLFTSLYPQQHGVLRGLLLAQRMERMQGARLRVNRLPRRAETIAEALGRAGYATYAIAQNPNLSEDMGFGQGFRSYTHFPRGLDAAPISARLAELRGEILGRPPYFLYLHFMDVHGPYRERAPLFDPSLTGDARKVSAYDSGIRHLDDHIARASALMGWERGTLVLVTADHGEELGDRGSFGHGATLFAELLDIPLLVYLPDGAQGGLRLGDRVSLVDVLPTLREAAGLPRAPTDAGVSLWPLLTGRAEHLEPRPLFAHLWRSVTQAGRETQLRATIEGDWKRIGGGPDGAFLFHLPSDPREERNLAREEPEIAARLRDRYLAFEAKSLVYPAEERELGLDAGALEELKALGYVN